MKIEGTHQINMMSNPHLYNISKRIYSGEVTSTYSYRVSKIQGMQVRGSKITRKNPNTMPRNYDETGNSSARFNRKSKIEEGMKRGQVMGSPNIAQVAGRNHHKNSVESSKIPRPCYYK